MKVESLKRLFESFGFKYERDDEYRRDFYYNDGVLSLSCGVYALYIEVFVDYYTMRINFRSKGGTRLCKSYRVFDELPNYDSLDELFIDFIKSCGVLYGVDFEEYKNKDIK